MVVETRRILLVEDEKSIRSAVAAYLEREGYWVTPAEDGQIALDEFAKRRALRGRIYALHADHGGVGQRRRQFGNEVGRRPAIGVRKHDDIAAGMRAGADQQHGGTLIRDNNQRVVNNFVANIKADSRNQVSLQYASKYVQETIDQSDYHGYTDLIGLEGRHQRNLRQPLPQVHRALNTRSILRGVVRAPFECVALACQHVCCIVGSKRSSLYVDVAHVLNHSGLPVQLIVATGGAGDSEITGLLGP